jgi:N-acetylmuramic acid 6-phosphate (MurNAc-6-P) etherase
VKQYFFHFQSINHLYYFSSLVTSIEACEDDPIAGASELQRVTESFEHVLFIGITCGLSAPFVGGQLEYCLDNLQKFTPVLIGFNPISMARRIHVPKWSNNRTFHDIALRMETTPGTLVLNPIIGPEPISGSSRMKGGTATKIILDTVFYLASTSNTTKASEVIEEYKTAINRMEIAGQYLAEVVEQAGEW